MTDYTPKNWQTGDKFQASDATEMSQELEQQEEHDAVQDATLQPKFMTGTVATAIGTVAKTVTLDAPWAAHVPVAGDWYLLKYTNGTTASGATVSINGSAALPVMLQNAGASASHHLTNVNGVMLYYFDGAGLNLVGSQINRVVDATAIGSSIAMRDANANLLADAFHSTGEFTVSAGGVTPMSVNSRASQYCTGTLAQTYTLPTTSIIAGWQYRFVNLSTGALTVNSSAGNLVATFSQNTTLVVECNTSTPTTAAHWSIMSFFKAAANTISAANSSGQPATYTFSGGANADTLAYRDAYANLAADVFVPSTDSTVTAAGTTTLTANSRQVQIFTGTTTQTCVLPTTSITAGWTITVINQSTGSVTIQSSNGSVFGTLPTNRVATVMANIATPTTPANWTLISYAGNTVSIVYGTDSAGGPGAYAISQSSSSASIAQRDTNNNLLSDAFLNSADATVSSASTLTLNTNYRQTQIITGTLAQVVLLPTTGVIQGNQWRLNNQSTGNMTVNASGGTTVAVLSAGETLVVEANTNTPTVNTHWSVMGGTTLGQRVSVPANASSTGSPGQWAVDSSFAYYCVTANTWKRVAIATW